MLGLWGCGWSILALMIFGFGVVMRPIVFRLVLLSPAYVFTVNSKCPDFSSRFEEPLVS